MKLFHKILNLFISRKEDLIIFGSSGHAKVIIDAIEKQNKYNIIGVLDKPDQESNEYKQNLFGYPILGTDDALPKLFSKNPKLKGIIAIGENKIRKKIAEKIMSLCPDFRFATIIHPRASLALNSTIQEGSVILGNSSVGVEVQIGRHVIINTNATIEHESTVEDFSSLAPNVVLGGNVKIKEMAFLGIGAKAIPGMEIGQNTIVAAGAVVIKSLPDNVTAMGVPATIRNTVALHKI